MAYNKNTSGNKEPVNVENLEKKQNNTNTNNKADFDYNLFYKMLEQNQDLIRMLAERGVEVNSVANSLNEEVKLIHLKDNAIGLTTHIELSNLTLDMGSFGEERTLDRRQAEEVAGKYRKFFERGIIAFGAGSEHLASKFGLKSISDYSYLDKDFFKKLGSISINELENLYNKVCDGHKQMIIEYFKRKILEKDSNFNNIHKIEVLNRISNGAMSGTTLDIKREAEEAAAAKN